MTKRKSIIATSVLAFVMCLTLVLGVSLGATTLVAHAEESKNMPQIISVVDRNGKVTEVDENMLNLPVGIVGETYYAKIDTANKYDTVYIKPYAEGTRGCLPNGLVFYAETNEIKGIPAESEAGVSRDVQIYCNNEYGSTNVLGWLNVYSADKKPTITGDIPATAYVDSYYSASVEVGGYNKSFKATLEGSYPEGMEAYPNGVYACISFTPTSEMAGKTYNFKLCVDNELGVVRKECTITVANEVVAPEFITETQPLGKTEDNPNGVRPVVGKTFEFWLQASGTNTEDNPLEFFLYKDGSIVDTNANGEYELGGNLYLTKKGEIYSTNVEAVTGNQISCTLGVRNKNSYDNYVEDKKYCYINIVNGYVVDDIIITPAETDVPKGGTRQFKIEVKGDGDFPTANWYFNSLQPKDENTTISQSGLLTIGANETRATLYVRVKIGTIYAEATIKIIEHTHTTRLVEAVAKTCTTDGNIKHYKCTICDSLFADASATQNLTEADVKISAGHEYTEMVGMVVPTCSTKGMQAHFRCKNCDKYFALGSLAEVTAESLEIDIDSTAHNTTHVDGKNATCAETGILAHEHCSLCNKNFYSDCVTEMTDIVEPKNNKHDLETVWTATADGHYHKCKREGCKDGGKVGFAAHTPDRSEATEENAVKCTECGYIITPALGHTHHLTLVPGTAATCQADGKKAYYTCDGCSEKFEDEAGTIAITADIETWGIIPKAHKFGEWIAEVPATKEATGTKAHKDCEFCGKHFDNDGNEIEDLTIAKLPSGGDQPGGEDNPGGNDNPGGEVIEPKQEGLSGGAIAGIVVGPVAVVGIGGFAIFWFAIKKKSFAELIAAIKGIFKKK